ncbi:MAG: hypothetical protein RL660_910 [Bacteroidota bacterium]
MKQAIKNLIKRLPIAFTKNQQYDRDTKRVLNVVLSASSNCIDIGCHKGEIMDEFLQRAPQGQHYGFEPIPNMYRALVSKYAQHPNVHIHELALSDKLGSTRFNYVSSNPAYSGMLKRQYDRPEEQDQQITVATNLLDNMIEAQTAITLIKIDVEGGEYQVLQGAKQTIARTKCLVIFEHGLGASDVYGTTPQMIFIYFASINYNITTMAAWLKQKAPFNEQQFVEQFMQKKNYYFLAYSATKQVK